MKCLRSQCTWGCPPGTGGGSVGGSSWLVWEAAGLERTFLCSREVRAEHGIVGADGFKVRHLKKRGSWGSPLGSGSCIVGCSRKVERLLPVGADLSLKTVLPRLLRGFIFRAFHLAPIVYQSLLRTIFALKKSSTLVREVF